MSRCNAEYMTFKETMIGDLQSIASFLIDAIIFVVSLACKILWTIFKVGYCILLLLALRDGVQWFLGTGKDNR